MLDLTSNIGHEEEVSEILRYVQYILMKIEKSK